MPDTPYSLPALSACEALDRAAGQSLCLVDMRKPAAILADGQRVVGAEVRDPFQLHHDDPLMQCRTPIAVFCVHGHEVSRFGCAMLLLHGREAYYVSGGYAELVAAGAKREKVDT